MIGLVRYIMEGARRHGGCTGRMKTFSIRDLREKTEDLVRTAESGEISVVTKYGQPIFMAIPLDESLLKLGIRTALAVRLFEDQTLSLGGAAKIADLSHEEFMQLLGDMAIPVIRYSAEELDAELK